MSDPRLRIIRNLEDAMDRIKELDDYNAFLEKTHAEVTHMTPAEIRESWRIYHEEGPKPKEALVA